MSQNNIPTPPRLTVTAWTDPAVEACGHRPGSPYIEAVWLGILGPSTTWAWQRLARLAAVRPATVIDTADLAVSLGLGEGLAQNAPISRTLCRMVAFHAAERHGTTLAVRLALGDVSGRQLDRLARSARSAHDQIIWYRGQRQEVTV